MKKLLAAVAVLAAVAMAAPVMAAADAPGYGVTIGGRIKADFGWQIANDDYISVNKADASVTNFFATLNSNSYLRTVFTSADKTTGAFFEMGMWGLQNRNNDGSNAADNQVNIRHAYGWWKVGSCKLLVGQFAGRLGDRYYAGQGLAGAKGGKFDLNGFGFIGGTRNPKLALQMDVNDNFGFEVSIGQAGAEVNSFAGYGDALDKAGNPIPKTSGTGNRPYQDYGSTNSYLPRLEVVLDFKFGNFMITPGAGIAYIGTKWDDRAITEPEDDNILSYLLWLPVKYENGPFYVMVNAYYGQNTDTDWTGENNGLYGTNGYSAHATYGGQPGALPFMNGKGEVEDTKSWGVGLAAGYSFTDQLAIKVGGGVTNLNNDAWEDVADSDDSYTRWAAFIALPYKLTSNFTIQPEVAYYNYGSKVGPTYNNNGNQDDAADEWVVGVHFIVLF